jgi:hypothetical protein
MPIPAIELDIGMAEDVIDMDIDMDMDDMEPEVVLETSQVLVSCAMGAHMAMHAIGIVLFRSSSMAIAGTAAKDNTARILKVWECIVNE